MRLKFTVLLVVLLIIGSTSDVMAIGMGMGMGPPNPPCGVGPFPPCPVPLDGGLAFLAGAGFLVGARVLKQKRSNK